MTDISGINGVNDGYSKLYTPTTEEVRDVYQSRLIQTATNIYALIDEAQADAEFDRWFAEELRKAKNDAWFEGFSAGWDECDDPSGFVNDKWDAKTPNPYGKENND